MTTTDIMPKQVELVARNVRLKSELSKLVDEDIARSGKSKLTCCDVVGVIY